MRKLPLCIMVLGMAFSMNSGAFDSKAETTEEMKSYLPNQDMSLTFKEHPLKFLEAIQLDYHFSSFDNGLERVKEALDHVVPLYEQDKNQNIFPSKLEDAQAYQVYSALLTLRGMMLTKKAMQGAGINADNDDEDGLRAQTVEMMKTAEKSLKEAIAIDPDSAEAYFQLGKYYQNASGGLSSDDTEKALFTAAELSKKQGNEKGSEQAKALLLSLNPQSAYLKELK